ncbi:MAG: hypothetical protein ACRDTS_06490 [Mycobacterium sp.]
MSIVQETIDVFPFTAAPRVLQRREELLLTPPVNFGNELAPLEVVHFDIEYAPVPFAPPTGTYEGDYLRMEWQTMNFRQPFYHRNTDVDELSYQINGERTLMTEFGTVELVPGDFSRIPRGVAHDNYGREESHLLFYLPAPVQDLQSPAKSSAPTIPPFAGWEPAPKIEFITDCLGGPGHAPVSVLAIDEQLLLEQAGHETDRINVLRADQADAGTTWLYRSQDIMIGRAWDRSADGRNYQRHLDVDEIQYQISGQRTLITQRGTLHVEPGDLVRIPVGVSFASLHHDQSAHLRLVSRHPVPQVAPTDRKAVQVTVDDVERLRRGEHTGAHPTEVSADV